MKKAVIEVSGKQYLVKEGDVLEVDHLGDGVKPLSFESKMVIGGDASKQPADNVKTTVTAEVLKALHKGPKIMVTRFKAKKRVKKTQGHKQRLTKIKISKIGK